tara:strand:- start:6736 stop:7101 length:366 start_codon:yes stop_codon:yes gene_type:complete
MTTDTVNLQEAVDTISKLSSNRILPYFEKEVEGEITKISIPIRTNNPNDTKDVVMRRFLSDWIKGKIEKISVECRYEGLTAGTSYYTDSGEEFPVVGCIVLQWWPRKHETEYEIWKKSQRK